MMQIGLIGIGSGVVAALLFASVTSGSYLSVALFYLAPLPIMIAGLGWSHWAALIAAAAGALLLASLFGGVFLFAFLAGAGLPAWWLSYLSMLARPVPGGADAPSPAGSLHWYPPGHLVVWAALLAAGVVLVAIPNFGLDADSFRAGLSHALSRMLHVESGTATDKPLSVPGVASPKQMLDFLALVVPPAAAVLATVTNLVNLWLAGRVVKFSSRLSRPWPDIAAMSFPVWAPIVFGLAIGLSFVGGMAAILAGVVAASMTMAYGVLGFAVLHATTRGLSARPFALAAAYASVLIFGWPVLALCLLGVVESFAGLRARAARKRNNSTT